MTTSVAGTDDATQPRQLGRASVAAVIVNVGGAGLRLGLQIVLARSLGASGYGRFVLGRSWGELLARFPDRGWELTSVKELPGYRRSGDHARFRGLMMSAWRQTLIGAVGLTVASLIAYALIVDEIDSAIAVGLLLITPLALTYLARALLQGDHRFVTGSALVEIAQPVAFGAAVGALWLADELTVEAALVAWILTMAATAAVSRYVLRRGLPTDVRRAEPTVEPQRWRSTRQALYASRLAQVVLDYADILVVGALLDPSEVATYAVATRVVVLGRVIITGVQSAASSHLAEAAAGRDWEATQRIVDRSLRICAAPSILVTIAAAALAGPLVGLFGDGYSEASTILRILLIGNLVNSITGPSAAVVSLSGLERVYAQIMWSAAAATLVLVTLGTAVIGLTGAAAAATLVMTGWNVCLLVVARSRLGVACWMRPATFARTSPTSRTRQDRH